MLPQTVQLDAKPAATQEPEARGPSNHESAAVRHLSTVSGEGMPRLVAETPARPAPVQTATAQGGMVDTSVLLTSEFRTVLSEDVEITGTIRATNSLVLRCQVVGDVIVTDRDGKGGTLVVDEKAKITGVVSARRVVLSGQVVGGVIGRELVEIAETARITGPVHYARMRQAEGAEVDGVLAVIRDGNDPTDRVIADLKRG